MAGAGARMSGIGEMWRYKRVLTASLVGTAVVLLFWFLHSACNGLECLHYCRHFLSES